MNDELKQEVLRYLPDAVFVSKNEWLDCLVYQDTRGFYDEWINENPAVLYVICREDRASMGARYGTDKPQYLSPYGDSRRIMGLWMGKSR